MRYLIDIHIAESKSRTYPIDAKDESEAMKRLKLRLPPDQREHIIIDAIRIDLTARGDDDPYGTFGGE